MRTNINLWRDTIDMEYRSLVTGLANFEHGGDADYLARKAERARRTLLANIDIEKERLYRSVTSGPPTAKIVDGTGRRLVVREVYATSVDVLALREKVDRISGGSIHE